MTEAKKKTRKLKLYVWEGVLTDYSSGMIVALAYNLKHARELVRKSCGAWVAKDTHDRPMVHRTPTAYFVAGGG